MSDTALPIIERLTIRRQFLYVAQGRKAAGRFVLLQSRSAQDENAVRRGLVRYGLTASKKVGNAVMRNRARRRLRQARAGAASSQHQQHTRYKKRSWLSSKCLGFGAI